MVKEQEKEFTIIKMGTFILETGWMIYFKGRGFISFQKERDMRVNCIKVKSKVMELTII